MSYADTSCPCGGSKLSDTLLCDACRVALAARLEWATLNNEHADPWLRRQAAIILVTLARKRGQTFTFATGYGSITARRCA